MGMRFKRYYYDDYIGRRLVGRVVHAYVHGRRLPRIRRRSKHEAAYVRLYACVIATGELNQ